MNQRILVEQEAIRCVTIRRRIVLEVPENSSLDPTWIKRDIAEGEKDWGPFPWDPVEGTESIEVTRTRVVRFTEEATDIPFVDKLPFSEPTNSFEKSPGLTPLEEPSVAPDCRAFRGEGTGVSEEPSLDFGRYMGRPIKKFPTRVLKRFHGELQGRNAVIADELRRRGLSSRELRELEWAHSQSLWRLSARKATVVRAVQRKKRRKRKLREHRKRQAQRRREVARRVHARVVQGFTVVGEHYVRTSDGSCPFGEGLVVSRKEC